MFMKLLFYSNKKEDFEWFDEFRSVFESEGYELAIGTYNKDLLEYLANRRYLVVIPTTYFEDIFLVKHTKPSWKPEALTWQEYLESL